MCLGLIVCKCVSLVLVWHVYLQMHKFSSSFDMNLECYLRAEKGVPLILLKQSISSSWFLYPWRGQVSFHFLLPPLLLLLRHGLILRALVSSLWSCTLHSLLCLDPFQGKSLCPSWNNDSMCVFIQWARYKVLKPCCEGGYIFSGVCLLEKDYWIITGMILIKFGGRLKHGPG